MGKTCKTKKPEKLGKGQVTPIQVAFIVDRYLSDNYYTQTLCVFRSEASTLLSKSKMREAPKSLLSLGDILNEYISLKEQKVFLEQEKCKVEKLLQGMQDVMREYQSSDTARGVPPLPEPVSPAPRLSSVITNSTPISLNMSSPSSTESLIPGVQSNNKKASGSVLQPTPSTKKPFVQSLAHPLSGTEVRPVVKEINHSNTPAMAQDITRYSLVQPVSERHVSYSSPMQELPIANSIMNQSSSAGWQSPSPKTPPQQYATQTDSPHSPLETLSSPLASLSLIQFSEPSPEVTPTSEHFCSSSTNENMEYYSGGNMYQDRQHSEFSPSKFGAKKFGKGEHIKARLDFNDSGMLMNSVRCSDEASFPANAAEASGSFNMDDILNFSILDSDVSLSYLIDSVMDFRVADLPDQSTLHQATNHISSPCTEGDMRLDIDSAFLDLPPNKRVAVLCEKDMNRQENDEQQISKLTVAGTKTSSPGKKQRRILSDQENVLMP